MSFKLTKLLQKEGRRGSLARFKERIDQDDSWSRSVKEKKSSKPRRTGHRRRSQLESELDWKLRIEKLDKSIFDLIQSESDYASDLENVNSDVLIPLLSLRSRGKI